MSPEKTEKLFNDFPLLYKNKNLPGTHSRVIDGFTMEDGWFDIVYDLSKELEEIIKNIDIEDKPAAFQMKSKLGGLRFYMDGEFVEEIGEAISEAESLSYKTCEFCGKEGSRKGKNWIWTACDPCWDQHEKRSF
jgi:hypothetical protein